MSDHEHHQHQHDHKHVHADGSDCTCELAADTASTTAIDAVCGMSVDKEGAQHVATYEGQTYYFCSANCRSTFLGNPREYINA